MSQSTFIFAVVVVAFLVFATMRGSLRRYVQLLT